MAGSTALVALYEEEYRIEKRADGTEDFHCILPSCAGVFTYRTLRALNNHRISTHKLPEIPKRKRGPKKSESSRTRCRSAEAIRRQVMKRATDISKREQGCRSMARLRALRLAMAQADGAVEGVVDKDHISQVIKEVDKSLESWESGASRRRLLLERRIQMARLEWTLKGEPLPLLDNEGELVTGVEGSAAHNISDKEMQEEDESGGEKECQSNALQNDSGGEKECDNMSEEQEVQMQCEKSFVQETNDNIEGPDGERIELENCETPKQQVQMQCENGLVQETNEKAVCLDKDEPKENGDWVELKNCENPKQQFQMQCENGSVKETNDRSVCFDKDEPKEIRERAELENCETPKQQVQMQCENGSVQETKDKAEPKESREIVDLENCESAKQQGQMQCANRENTDKVHEITDKLKGLDKDEAKESRERAKLEDCESPRQQIVEREFLEKTS